MSAKNESRKETKLKVLAIALVAFGCVGVFLGMERANRSGESEAFGGEERSTWLDARAAAPEAPADDLRGAPQARSRATVSRQAVELSPEPPLHSQSHEKQVLIRREDLGFEVPATSSGFDEISLRRNLDELRSVQEAKRALAERIEDACEGRCEEGLADLDASGAFGRESMAERRARLVERGEDVARVSRDLEFVEN